MTNSDVTIIIGENGLGKTVILESINAFFGGNYKFFSSLDFASFGFHFSNGEHWLLQRNKYQDGYTLQIARGWADKAGLKPKFQKIYSDFDRAELRKLRGDYAVLSDLDRELMSRDDYYRALVRRRHAEEVFYYESKYVHSGDRPEKNDLPKWFKDGLASVNVRLIETQRIISPKEIGGESYVSTVGSCSSELKDFISRAVKESADIASALDSTYPNRLVEKLKLRAEYSYQELNDALLKLDERRKNFSSAGLLVDAQDSDMARIETEQNDLIVLLKLYVDDSHEKLNPYEDLSKKIRLFMSIVNKRFKHKRLEINKAEGFIFRSTVIRLDDGTYAKIPHSKLSSGEQHELVLFYKLIFNSKVGDLVLVDEPELSLHISWQNKFINDLKEVAAMNGISAVIATHSPDIISENWDLKVELVGVE